MYRLVKVNLELFFSVGHRQSCRGVLRGTVVANLCLTSKGETVGQGQSTSLSGRRLGNYVLIPHENPARPDGNHGQFAPRNAVFPKPHQALPLADGEILDSDMLSHQRSVRRDNVPRKVNCLRRCLTKSPWWPEVTKQISLLSFLSATRRPPLEAKPDLRFRKATDG